MPTATGGPRLFAVIGPDRTRRSFTSRFERDRTRFNVIWPYNVLVWTTVRPNLVLFTLRYNWINPPMTSPNAIKGAAVDHAV